MVKSDSNYRDSMKKAQEEGSLMFTQAERKQLEKYLTDRLVAHMRDQRLNHKSKQKPMIVEYELGNPIPYNIMGATAWKWLDLAKQKDNKNQVERLTNGISF